MTPTVELMQNTARALCRRALFGDPAYRAMEAEAEALRAQFRNEHPDALCARVLQILDACLALSDMEGDQLFLTGLQMGLELGGLDCLPGDCPPIPPACGGDRPWPSSPPGRSGPG